MVIRRVYGIVVTVYLAPILVYLRDLSERWRRFPFGCSGDKLLPSRR